MVSENIQGKIRSEADKPKQIQCAPPERPRKSPETITAEIQKIYNEVIAEANDRAKPPVPYPVVGE